MCSFEDTRQRKKKIKLTTRFNLKLHVLLQLTIGPHPPSKLDLRLLVRPFAQTLTWEADVNSDVLMVLSLISIHS